MAAGDGEAGLAGDGAGELREGEGDVGAFDPDGAAVDLEVFDGGFHHVAGDEEQLVAHAPGCDVGRGAGEHGLPAVGAADAERGGGGVAGDDVDIAEVAAELFGDDLRQHGARALAHGGGAGGGADAAGGLDADRDVLVGATAGAFDVVGEADAAVTPGGAGGCLARGERGPAGAVEGELLAARVVAAIQHDLDAAAGAHRRRVRHALGGDEVAAADLGTVETQFARGAVEQALHGEHALRLAGAADRGDRDLVGDGGADRHAEGRHHVGKRHGGDGALRHVDAAGGPGAVIVHQLAADAQNATVRVGGELDVPVLVAFLGGGGEVFEAVLDPFDGTAEVPGGEGHHRLLRVEDQLGAEAAADIGRDHAELRLAEAEHVAEQALGGVRGLGGGPDGQPVLRRVGRGDDAAAFHRVAAAAVDPELFAEAVRGGGEGGVDRAVFHGHLGDEVGGRVAVGARGAGLQGVAAVGGGGQRVVFHLDQARGVLGDVAVVGQHDGDGFADEDDLMFGEHGPVQLEPVAWAG